MNKKSPRKHFRGVQIIGILQKLFFDDLGEGFAPKLSFGKFGILCVLRAFQKEKLGAKGEFLEVPYRLGT